MLQSFILLPLSVVKCACHGNLDVPILLRGFVYALGFVYVGFMTCLQGINISYIHTYIFFFFFAYSDL